MTFGCVGPGSITLVCGFRYFVLSAFRYFVFFSVFTVSGIRSGEGIGSRPAVGCLTRLMLRRQMPQRLDVRACSV